MHCKPLSDGLNNTISSAYYEYYKITNITDIYSTAWRITASNAMYININKLQLPGR